MSARVCESWPIFIVRRVSWNRCGRPVAHRLNTNRWPISLTMIKGWMFSPRLEKAGNRLRRFSSRATRQQTGRGTLTSSTWLACSIVPCLVQKVVCVRKPLSKPLMNGCLMQLSQGIPQRPCSCGRRYWLWVDNVAQHFPYLIN